MNVTRASAWADAVFHVLAHIDVPGPGSCFSPVYCAWIARALGPATERPLGDDIALLETLLRDSPALASVQGLAWVFHSGESAAAAVEKELAAASVDDSHARDVACAAGPCVEIVRAAAELEMPLLPGVELDEEALAVALERAARAAPALTRCRVEVTAALPLRGRVLDAHIYVGVPGIAGAEVDHVAWQAAHEATVDEISASGSLEYVEVERRAIALLRSRARRAGLAAEHARWLARLDLSGLGAIPDVDDPA